MYLSMEIIQLKYMTEIAKTGSITQAAANLNMTQPNLSKAIKSLESELGFAIFKRSSKGVFLTKEGESFMISAREVLQKFEELEGMHKPAKEAAHSFGISVPRASYIAYAFTQFVNELSNAKQLKIDYCETNSAQTIRNITMKRHNLGIIRIAEEYEKYYQKMLREINLKGELLLSFRHLALMSIENPLADKSPVSSDDLSDLIELIHGDSSIPVSVIDEINRDQFSETGLKNINIYERGSQFDLLHFVKNTYMWVSPLLPETLNRQNLVQKKIQGIENHLYKDILIFNRHYQLTNTECLFLKHLYAVRDQIET